MPPRSHRSWSWSVGNGRRIEQIRGQRKLAGECWGLEGRDARPSQRYPCFSFGEKGQIQREQTEVERERRIALRFFRAGLRKRTHMCGRRDMSHDSPHFSISFDRLRLSCNLHFREEFFCQSPPGFARGSRASKRSKAMYVWGEHERRYEPSGWLHRARATGIGWPP